MTIWQSSRHWQHSLHEVKRYEKDSFYPDSSSADDSVTVTLKDASGAVLNTYTLDQKTGVGKDALGVMVNLPQTGTNSFGTVAAVSGAALTALAGALLVTRAFRKKKDN